MGEILDIKTGAIINPDEQQDPHLTMQTLDNKVHVIPVSVFDDIIKGEIPIAQLDDWEIICRTIFAMFLRTLKNEN